MNPLNDTMRCLEEWDALAERIDAVMNQPHALDNIRASIRQFEEVHGRYPREMHQILTNCIMNYRKQSSMGQILRRGD